jgi:hypothetical protein
VVGSVGGWWFDPQRALDEEVVFSAAVSNGVGCPPISFIGQGDIALRKNVRTIFESCIYTFSDCFKFR